MEKLWAKVNGNYAFVVGGNVEEAFTFLLGAPSFRYSMDDAEIGYNSADRSSISVAASNAWKVI